MLLQLKGVSRDAEGSIILQLDWLPPPPSRAQNKLHVDGLQA